MRISRVTGSVSKAVMNIMVLGSLTMADSGVSEAAGNTKYATPPFGAFSSQMPDALLGSAKYEKPLWNLQDALGLPGWLDFSVEQRTRYETIDGRYRAGGSGGDQQIALQNDVFLQAHLGRFRAGVEFLDARALGVDSGSTLNNTHANNADFVQGYVAWANQNVFFSGIGAEIIAGRQTLNLGSRRLVARNVFRNTLNNFTGVRLRLVDYGSWEFNGFVTMPVIRYPNNAADLLDEIHQFDEEDTHTWFSGGILQMHDLFNGLNAEVYLYHLDEGDSIYHQTRNRRYFTPGMRFYLKPKAGQFDFQLEAIGQLGTVRSSTAATNGTDLDHAAWYQHIDIGYTFDMPWKPRLALEYDYASGDEDPNDNKDQRFDTLYGARRFEFGPTGMYGAFARSNINTPGYRIQLAPRSDLKFNARHRVFWLASDRDAWTTSGLRDISGNTSDYIGHQLEMSVRWNVNSSLNFETGWAHLFKGEFAKNTTNAPQAQDTDYFYVESLLRF